MFKIIICLNFTMMFFNGYNELYLQIAFLGDRLSHLGFHTSDGIGIVNLLLVLWPNH